MDMKKRPDRWLEEMTKRAADVILSAWERFPNHFHQRVDRFFLRLPEIGTLCPLIEEDLPVVIDLKIVECQRPKPAFG
ncbi:hypothetical protein NKJ59_07575 [Mesorhizobium australicum]